MKVLVTGGTGVVGQAAVTALVERGHEVRLFSRNAVKDAEAWPRGVEAYPGSVGDADDVAGSAEGCDAILHVAGIVKETPPEVTFENTNVEGTRHVVREATRAKVGRLIYVSSLGADRGESDYHQSKRRAEEVVRTFQGSWTIVRPGNVYGPGDELISLILQMVRSLPVVPVIDLGEQPFEPMWTDDLGEALAQAVERDDLGGRTLDIAGPDRTSMNDVINRLQAITGRSVMKVPVPNILASTVAKLAGAANVPFPVSENELTMLGEENVIRGENALVTVFNVTPTPLDQGLKKLADALPDQLPEDGVGTLKRKRFWADIEGSTMTPEQLLERFRAKFGELTPWHLDVGVEPGSERRIEEGHTVTMSLPFRGNIQIRVAELLPRRMTFLTVEGHPLAGAVRFLAERRGDAVRFEIQVYDRAANFVDWATMTAFGNFLQNRTWESTVNAVVDESGGKAPKGVESETTSLDPEQAKEIQEWLEDLSTMLKRESREASPESPHSAEPRPAMGG